MSNQAQGLPIMDRAAFESWLKEQPREVHFIRCSAGTCPLARYIGGSVTESYYRLATGSVQYPMPSWGHDFVRAFDREGKIGSAVGARTALRILRAIK